ncbi:MAG: exodeoxyribonuclease VII large subunit, partial [Burkholderiaceae bacterium]
ARLWRELRAPMPARARLQVLLAAWSRLARLRLARARERVAALDQNLAHLNPQGVLDRGYALVRDAQGRIVQRAAQLAPHDPVSITLAHGSASAVISRVDAENL